MPDQRSGRYTSGQNQGQYPPAERSIPFWKIIQMDQKKMEDRN